MKNKLGHWGLLGIPLALLGVVTSVAVAAPKTTPTPPVATTSITSPTTSDTDVETNDVAGAEAQDATGAEIETNDDASGPQEVPGVEEAD